MNHWYRLYNFCHTVIIFKLSLYRITISKHQINYVILVTSLWLFILDMQQTQNVCRKLALQLWWCFLCILHWFLIKSSLWVATRGQCWLSSAQDEFSNHTTYSFWASTYWKVLRREEWIIADKQTCTQFDMYSISSLPLPCHRNHILSHSANTASAQSRKQNSSCHLFTGPPVQTCKPLQCHQKPRIHKRDKASLIIPSMFVFWQADDHFLWACLNKGALRIELIFQNEHRGWWPCFHLLAHKDTMTQNDTNAPMPPQHVCVTDTHTHTASPCRLVSLMPLLCGSVCQLAAAAVWALVWTQAWGRISLDVREDWAACGQQWMALHTKCSFHPLLWQQYEFLICQCLNNRESATLELFSISA